MNPAYLLAIDQGTTGTRALLFDQKAKPVSSAYREYRQFFPRPGWVEHDPEEIWRSAVRVISEALKKQRTSSAQTAVIGITNQRETTVLWSRKTGKLFANAIVWQDRRTASYCDQLKKRGLESMVRRKTGLVLDPYFSGTKIHWLLNHHSRIRRAARQGDVLFGTIDTWLLWKLTGGRIHATDHTNASRTLLYNIRAKKWDSDLLKLFGIPPSMLPEVKDSGALFGRTAAQGPLKKGIPIHSMIGDQQAALYGQGCYKKGEVKNTYGTGCFVVLNLGQKLPRIPSGLLATIACDREGKPCYALEGSIFIAGAAVQWLRDGLRFFKEARETEKMIRHLKDSGGVTVVPAFAGLGSPHWNPHVRGLMTGLTRGTERGHIIRATLESIAHQTADVIDAMEKQVRGRIRVLKVDGGATGNSFLMQTQADLIRRPVLVTPMKESTAWGAAKLAGYRSGFWPKISAIDSKGRYQRFRPKQSRKSVNRSRFQWKKVVQCLLTSTEMDVASDN